MSTLESPEQGEDREHFGKKIRVLRKIRRLSQEDLAREIGVSLSTVQRWETRGGKPIRLARKELQKFLREAGIDENL
jgi:DNA-binding transcriptional regulator YiaG